MSPRWPGTTATLWKSPSAAPLVGRAETHRGVQCLQLCWTECVCPSRSWRALSSRSTAATTPDLKSLRDKARSQRLGALDVDELYARQRAAREFRHWRDELGMVCGSFSLLPEVGVPFVNRLEAETGRVRRAARHQASTEPYGAHAADAFANMIAGEGKGHATRADMNLVCDLWAWRRGHTEGEEVCAIVGGGPIPVEV